MMSSQEDCEIYASALPFPIMILGCAEDVTPKKVWTCFIFINATPFPKKPFQPGKLLF